MEISAFWSKGSEDLLQTMQTTGESGLSQAEAAKRLGQAGPNRIHDKEQVTPLGLFLGQFKSPIVLILVFATLLSAFLGDWVDAFIIMLIVLGSALLSFSQEYNAHNAAENCADRSLSRPPSCGMDSPFRSPPRTWSQAISSCSRRGV